MTFQRASGLTFPREGVEGTVPGTASSPESEREGGACHAIPPPRTKARVFEREGGFCLAAMLFIPLSATY